MKQAVVVNDLVVYRQRSGIGFYARQLLKHLPVVAPELEVIRLSRTAVGAPLRWASRLYESQRKRAEGSRASAGTPPMWRSVVKRGLGAAQSVGHTAIEAYTKLAARCATWPLYHEPDCLPLPIPAPTVTTVHDLSVLLFPDWHPAHRVERYRRNLDYSIAQTTQFITDAQSTKTDMVRLLGIAPERIAVVPLAPRPEFVVLPPAEVAAAKARLNLPENYFLYVGTIEPRKNLAGLLTAYAQLPTALRHRLPLVLAGGWGWQADTVKGMLEQPPWRHEVRWLGYLPDADLVAVTNGAFAVLYPSVYEGFGLPPLEAMACGRPVLTTHCGSLAEVIQDAALIVDPHDVAQMADGMRQLAERPDLAEHYARRGQAHVRQFSWAETVRQTAHIYRQFGNRSARAA